ncbi:hypothetical protein Kpho02_03100 [Kitasatospora phosalacinea]|uniref:Uncharacterized protein n=1 Tax=Kitasatospora phosalacinea TaxID=2065 RepID=A0A9W6UXT9_9ACTN|nr:hypothetical protein Kpho02_03100 [Kitasatospora phosalacinea]
MNGEDDAEQGWHVRSLREGMGWLTPGRPVGTLYRAGLGGPWERRGGGAASGRAAAPRAQVVGVDRGVADGGETRPPVPRRTSGGTGSPVGGPTDPQRSTAGPSTTSESGRRSVETA